LFRFIHNCSSYDAMRLPAGVGQRPALLSGDGHAFDAQGG
jgi:hypothetical protein